MKCPKCDGTGKAEIGVGAFTIHGADCDQCNGKGVIEPMTNEEYIHSLNTEQLAEWFGDWHSFSCVFCKHWRNGCVYNHNQVRCAIEEGKSNKELWMEWLKQPHREE